MMIHQEWQHVWWGAALLREGPLVNQCLASEAGKTEVHQAAASSVRLTVSSCKSLMVNSLEDHRREETQRRETKRERETVSQKTVSLSIYKLTSIR